MCILISVVVYKVDEPGESWQYAVAHCKSEHRRPPAVVHDKTEVITSTHVAEMLSNIPHGELVMWPN